MTASGDYDLPLHRLRGLPAGRGIKHFGYTRVGGPGSGDSGYLPGLALPPADLAEYPPAGILPLGDSDVHAELAPVYPHRVTATNDPGGDLRGLLPDDVDALRSGRVPGGDRCSLRVDLPSYLPPPQGEPAAQGARPLAPLAERSGDRLLGDAGGGLPGRSARSSRRVSRPRSRPLSHLLRHLRHPRGPGSDVAAIDPVARHPRRRGPRERGNQGPPPGGGGGYRADRRAGGGGLGLRRHRGEDARHVRLPTTPLRYPPRQRYRQTCRGLCRGPRWRP